MKAWSNSDEKENRKETNDRKKSLSLKRDSLTTSINNSKLSLKNLLSYNGSEKVDQPTYIEPLAPIMSYSSQNQIEPSTNMVRVVLFILQMFYQSKKDDILSNKYFIC